MPSYFRRSLLGKTLLIVSISAFIVAAVLMRVIWSVSLQSEEDQTYKRLNELVDSTAVMASIACYTNDTTLARETAQAFVKHSDVFSVVILSSKGELARIQLPGVNRMSYEISRSQPLLTRSVYSPFNPAAGVGKVIVEPNWEKLDQSVKKRAKGLIITLAVFALVIVSLVASVFIFFVIRPVKTLSDRLHVIDVGDGQRLEVAESNQHNELGLLADDINHLMERLRDALVHENELRMERVLNEQLRLSAAVFEHSHEGILITDADNNIVDVNRAFGEITGYTREEVIGANPHVLASGMHDGNFYAELWNRLLAHGYWNGEIWNRRKNDGIYPAWFSISMVKDGAGRIMNHIGIFSDISARKEAENQVVFLAHHDPLTKLPNRILLRDRFGQARAQALREQTKIAVIFLDLDNFKHINDSYGHTVGDEFLIMVVERLRRAIREGDTISRQGGDEFIVILPHIGSLDVISRIANDILCEVAEPASIEGHAISTSGSIGIAVFPDDAQDFDGLLSNADAAMYDAKEKGKNGYCFYSEELNKNAAENMRLKSMLHVAKKNNELCLHYQPQIDIKTGNILGVESLLRWTHPVEGMISPAKFIPLAEESGLITSVGEWVLNEACRQGRQWLDEGVQPMVIAVNISAIQINRGHLFESVQNALQRWAYPPELLELEFTESTLLNNVSKVADTIQQVKELGVRLAIDDFGTGYSSLSYLKQIKVDKIKIDKSFIRDLNMDMDDHAIVSAIILMGQSLQLRVIAEGVETAEQLDVLESLGCDEAQGFYLGKPLPAAELARTQFFTQ